MVAEIFELLTFQELELVCNHFFGTEPCWENVGEDVYMGTKHATKVRSFATVNKGMGKRQKCDAPAKLDLKRFECPRCEALDETKRHDQSKSCYGEYFDKHLMMEIKARRQRIDKGEQNGDICGEELEQELRAARKWLYREYINVAFGIGTLGKGVRVRIPPCVIEFVRETFRASKCRCAKGTLADCTNHFMGCRESG